MTKDEILNVVKKVLSESSSEKDLYPEKVIDAIADAAKELRVTDKSVEFVVCCLLDAVADTIMQSDLWTIRKSTSASGEKTMTIQMFFGLPPVYVSYHYDEEIRKYVVTAFSSDNNTVLTYALAGIETWGWVVTA